MEWEQGGLPVSGNPDFAAIIGGQRTVIEAATIAAELPDGEHRRREIVGRIGSIRGPWVLTPDLGSPGLLEAKLSTIEAKAREYLDNSAPRVRHRAQLDLGDGRRLRMGVIPGQRADARVAVLNFTMIESSGLSRVRREVKDKSTKYAGLKDAGIPFVVALFAQSALVDEESLFERSTGSRRSTSG